MIPADIHDFLRLSLRSVWTLELLLLLHRQPDRGWREEKLVVELRASQTVIGAAVADLVAIGLVSRGAAGELAYRAASPLHDLVERLSTLYRERPVAVTQAVHAAANAKIQTFADSFKLRKD